MFKLYSDLIIEIQDYKDEINNAKRTRDNLMKQLENRKPKEINGQAYDDMPKGSKDLTSMDRTLIRIDTLTKRIDAYTEVLNDRLKDKEKIENDLTKCEGLQYKVFYLNRIEGKTLWTISEILGYSYQYIKEVNSDIHKQIEKAR